MGEAIAAAGKLQEMTGATVQLLHHPTRDNGTSRGSGAIKGAADSELWMKKTASNLLFKLTVGKAKEADDGFELDLKKRVVELKDVFENDCTIGGTSICAIRRVTCSGRRAVTATARSKACWRALFNVSAAQRSSP